MPALAVAASGLGAATVTLGAAAATNDHSFQIKLAILAAVVAVVTAVFGPPLSDKLRRRNRAPDPEPPTADPLRDQLLEDVIAMRRKLREADARASRAEWERDEARQQLAEHMRRHRPRPKP